MENVEMKMNIPAVEPLFFCVDLAEGFHLPAQYTQDEHEHLGPNGIENILLNSREFQHAWLIQGTSSGNTFEINFLKSNKNWGGISLYDLSSFDMDDSTLINKLISFEGTDATGSYVRSDEGFDGTQASLGVLSWQPEAAITQNAGHYQSAHFLIENPERTKVIQTLDFDLEIINNDVAIPEKHANYVSELNRLLVNFDESIKSGQKQLAFYQSLYVGIMQNNIASLNDTADKAIKDMNDKTDAAIKANQEQLDTDTKNSQAKIDKLVSDSTAHKDEVDKSLNDLEDRQRKNDDDITQNKADIAANAEDIKSAGVVTQDNAKTVMQDILDTGGLSIGKSDPATDSKMDQMNKMLEGDM
ncbi:hypothetical protein [Companilactobacillus kedongensis]|uniref:hypothetical protein n=1 Tax=Companilactobacillus kedongensis TaxID=2486004 RepID=UPI000F769867|nr:hypothetical protein [Companilactobacillus kedongensis]